MKNLKKQYTSPKTTKLLNKNQILASVSGPFESNFTDATTDGDWWGWIEKPNSTLTKLTGGGTLEETATTIGSFSFETINYTNTQQAIQGTAKFAKQAETDGKWQFEENKD